MNFKLAYVTPLLVTGATAVAIAVAPLATAAVAPVATAATGQSCAADGDGSICQSPGNAQIDDSPPGGVGFYPYGGDAFLLGGNGGPHGGGHR